MPHLIVGLGNPGREYEGTRHNFGFDVVAAFAKKKSIPLKRDDKFHALIGRGEAFGKDLLLALPLTYMNLSGNAVRKIMDYYKVPIEKLLVVADDVAIDFGTLRLRTSGTSGGQKGLLHIQELLGTKEYARLKVGIGPKDSSSDLADFVLGKFTEGERDLLPEIIKGALAVLGAYLEKGVLAAQPLANSFIGREE